MGDGIINNFILNVQHNANIELLSSFHHFIWDTLIPIKGPNTEVQINEVRKSISKELVLLYTGSIIIEGAHTQNMKILLEKLAGA